MRYVKTDGSAIPKDHCVRPDHYVTTVTVTIRSMSPLALSRVNDLIQQQYEVTKLQTLDMVCVCK